VLIPTGDGAFVGEIVEPPAGGRFAIGQTWLAEDMKIADHPALVVVHALTMPASPA
jgi:hypothetical protein